MYESPDKTYLEQPQELSDLVDSTKIMHRYFLKQVDIVMYGSAICIWILRVV